MYSYLRGVYKGRADDGLVLLEVAGVGYEVLVPPIVEQEIAGVCEDESPLRLFVSAQSGRDQPWPVLFGFLRPEEKAFWELLKSVPRVGGKGAAKAMSMPVARIAQAIQAGDRGFLDSLPGVTLEGADKMIASLRKKVGPFTQVAAGAPTARRTDGSVMDEIRDDAVQLLTVMGVKRPDAMRAVDDLVATRDDVTSVQDVITAYFRLHGRTG